MGPSADTPAWKPLGELLVEQSWITPADLEEALEEQERTGRKLGQIVVENGFISVEGLTKVLLEQCGIDMSTQDGFGSGLREELAKRGGRRGSEPVRFEFNVEPEPEKRQKRQKREKEPKQERQERQEKPKEAPRPERTSRRVRFGRNPNREPLKRLEKLAKDFERQERELVETITSLRQMLRPVGD
ncbi:MAG: type pilus assembly protein PilB [Gaiellaceae bacterium]|jgi:hypothetical protein|nr:type pilus assembly protein PilB [Gaiellaceae bacterium]